MSRLYVGQRGWECGKAKWEVEIERAEKFV